jgi:hypothetical protein
MKIRSKYAENEKQRRSSKTIYKNSIREAETPQSVPQPYPVIKIAETETRPPQARICIEAGNKSREDINSGLTSLIHVPVVTICEARGLYS